MRTSRARRALGQHFLTNASAARKIVESFAPAPGEPVIEIGPGTGALTGLLLEAGACVIAVELDARLVAGLERRFGDTRRLHVVHGDVLECDLKALSGGRMVRVIANLPYSITGPVMVKLLASSGTVSSMMLMLQREVTERLVARTGGKEYGSLSVLAQYFTEPQIILRLRPGSFSPPPAVSSSVVAMPFRRRRELSIEQEGRYPPFVRLLFAHRRRTLMNNLRASGIEEPSRVLALAGIDPSRRAQTLTREEVVTLFRKMEPPAGGPD